MPVAVGGTATRTEEVEMCPRTMDLQLKRVSHALLLLLTVCAAVLLFSSSASAEFGVQSFDGEVVNIEGGTPVAATQAGAHPAEASTTIVFNQLPDPLLGSVSDGSVKDIRVDLPPGFVGNPTAAPKCTDAQLTNPGNPLCPGDSQVGVVRIKNAAGLPEEAAVYNMVPPPGVPGAFAFIVANYVPVHLRASVRSATDYGLSIDISGINQALPVLATSLTIWGVPADSSHDADRPRGATLAPRKAFLTNPTLCNGPLPVGLTTTSWRGETRKASFLTHLTAPDEATLAGPEGCDRVPFDVSTASKPSVGRAGSPSGLEFEIAIPQSDAPDELGQAHLKKTVVMLPEGVSISPTVASGLVSCSDAQSGIGTDDDPVCPEASKIGSVSVETPLLEKPMDGAVYVGAQASDDPGSGEMFRMFLVARGPGVVVKLAGSVVPDPVTGRLTVTFDNNPQLPFSTLTMRLKGGARAPLVTPSMCGVFRTTSVLTSWSAKTVESSAPMAIDAGCDAAGKFAPSFAAGTTRPVSGAFSPFAVNIAKPDGHSDLDGVSLSMPEGLLANLRGNVGSRVGTARVASGPGSSPFWLSGPVVLEGPYGDAPFSLRVTVPAVAGPFNLGDVVVRQKVYVDPDTAQVRVVSDPLPTIVKGVPVKLQNLVVDVDRPGFMLNPTSCAPKTVDATLKAVSGQTAAVSSRFQVGECAGLGFQPKMAMRLTGKGQVRTGDHPGFKTVLTQGKGQANIGKVKVTMPRSIALDANNSYDPKLVCDYDKSLKADCPASSVIGKATANTPVLNKPLTGNVHLVQGIKFGAKGNRIRTTPSLLVKLRGEVAIDLRGKTTTEKGTNRLVTTFPAVPDAPVSKFTLKVNGGSKGILTVTRTRRAKINLCSASQIANVETDGQNGKRADYTTKVKTPCGKVAKAKRGAKRR